MKPTLRDVIDILFGLVLGLVLLDILFRWPVLKADFFEITLVECLQLLVALLVGSVISFWVGSLARHQTRLTAVCDNLLDTVQSKLAESYAVSLEYMKDPKKVKQKTVLLTLKTLSSHISLLEKVEAKRNLGWGQFLPRLKEEYRNIKEGVTGGVFGGEGRRYEQNKFDEVERARAAMAECLTDARLSLHL